MDTYAIATGLFALTTVAAGWKWLCAHIQCDTNQYVIELLHEDIAAIHERERDLGRRLAEYIADEQKRLAPLKAANAKRHAARLQREAAEAHARNERDAELRELVGDLM